VKIAVISDIHGNRLALEAVLDDIARHKVDGIFNLGDLVSGPLEPNWVADILMDVDIPTVRGNHERELIEKPPNKLNKVDRFTQEQMESRHRGWLNALPPTLALLDDIFLCHGTPTSDD
jgi:predicted phosphodiesterase